MSTHTVQNATGAQALHYNLLSRARLGYSVIDVSGGALQATTGTNSDEVDIASGDYLWNGTRKTFSGGTVTISGNFDDNPRRDVIYLDGNNTLQTTQGSNAEPTNEEQNANLSTHEHYHPAVPDLASTDAVVIADVWVAGNSSDIASSDIRDLRVDSQSRAAAMELAAQASKSVTLSGGDAVQDFRLDGVLSDQEAELDIAAWVDSDPAFNADYAWHVDGVSRVWDDSEGAIDLEARLVWDTDPGNNNDVSITLAAVERDTLT